MALPLFKYPTRKVEGQAEEVLQIILACNLLGDVANGAAEVGPGCAKSFFCSLELPCAAIALVPDQSELTKLRIGLAVIELCLHPLQIFRQSEPRIVTAVTREASLQESQSYRLAFLQDRRLRPTRSEFLNERFRDFSTDAAEQYRLTCDNHTLALDLPDLDDHPICLPLICGGNLNISRNVLQPHNTEARICNDASEFFFASEFA